MTEKELSRVGPIHTSWRQQTSSTQTQLSGPAVGWLWSAMPWATVPPLFTAALLRALFVDVSSKLWGESVTASTGDETPAVRDSSWDPDALTALQAQSAAGAGDPGAVQVPGSHIQVRVLFSRLFLSILLSVIAFFAFFYSEKFVRVHKSL